MNLSYLDIYLYILHIAEFSEKVFFLFWCSSPQWAKVSSFTRFIDHTQHTTVSRNPLDEWSTPHRDLCLTTHNTHNRHPSMPPVGFEPTTSANKRPQTYTLEHAATGISLWKRFLTVITRFNCPDTSISIAGLGLHFCCDIFSLLHRNAGVHQPPTKWVEEVPFYRVKQQSIWSWWVATTYKWGLDDAFNWHPLYILLTWQEGKKTTYLQLHRYSVMDLSQQLYICGLFLSTFFMHDVMHLPSY
jgi:hypothetical protein